MRCAVGEDGREILCHQMTGWRIRAHPQLWAAACTVRVQQLPNALARRGQLWGRHRVLEIEDHRVRGAGQGLLLLALAVARDKEP